MSELEGLGGGCSPSNEFNGRIGIRVSAIFVILAGSLFGEEIIPDIFNLICLSPLLIP